MILFRSCSYWMRSNYTESNLQWNSHKSDEKQLFLWTPIIEVLSTKQLQQCEVSSDPQKAHTTLLDRFLWLLPKRSASFFQWNELAHCLSIKAYNIYFINDGPMQCLSVQWSPLLLSSKQQLHRKELQSN